MDSSTTPKVRRPLQVNRFKFAEEPVATPSSEPPLDPIRAFSPFEWHGTEVLQEAQVRGQPIADFINLVDDLAGGIHLILQIQQAHEQDHMFCQETYFRSVDIGRLEMMAIRAAQVLKDESEKLRDKLVREVGKQP
ncbi:MAG: hypothetical protein PGN26_14375 [Xylophilus ampelinus]